MSGGERMKKLGLATIVLLSFGCALKGPIHKTGGSTQEVDFVTPEQVFSFAAHDLRLGLSRGKVESHVGVGIMSTHGLYMYESKEDTLLAIEYGPEDTVVRAWLIADEIQKWELRF